VPWLELLTQDAGTRGIGEAIAWKLGPRRQDLTYRLFRHLFAARPGDPPEYHGFFPSHLERFLPVIRALSARAKRDPEFLGACLHFLRFKGEIADQEIDRILNPPKDLPYGTLFEALLVPVFPLYFKLRDLNSPDILDFARKHPAVMEAGLHLRGLRSLSVAWFFGMPSLPEIPDFSTYFPLDDVSRLKRWNWSEDRYRNAVAAWVRENKGQLFFDPALGRFVLDPKAPPAEPKLPPRPGTPLPGWSGPSPSWPSPGVNE